MLGFIAICLLFGLPAMLLVQLLILPVFIPICRRKGVRVGKFVALSLIPYVGIPIIIHVLAMKDSSGGNINP